jgi:uncharacterized protein (DUF433 family)
VPCRAHHAISRDSRHNDAEAYLERLAMEEAAMKQDVLERVTRSPEQCGGVPCIRGLRMQVTDILGLLGSGASHQEILADYSFLQEEDIYAALQYAAAHLNNSALPNV